MSDAVVSKVEEALRIVLETVKEKSEKYNGDSHNKAARMLAIARPDGIKPEEYADALKLFRILEKIARGELDGPDVAAYALMLMDVRKGVETSDSDREEPQKPCSQNGFCIEGSDFMGCRELDNGETWETCKYGGKWKEEPIRPSIASSSLLSEDELPDCMKYPPKHQMIPCTEFGKQIQRENFAAKQAKEEPEKPRCYAGIGGKCQETFRNCITCESCPWGGAWKEGKERLDG